MKDKYIINSDYKTFTTFAKLYPVQAFDLRPKDFCKFFREVTEHNITDESISAFVDSIREPEKQ